MNRFGGPADSSTYRKCQDGLYEYPVPFAMRVLRYFSFGLVSATPMSLHLLNKAAYPDAVCNDGTQSGYYFHRSPTQSTTWIVHANGGGWCYDKKTCAERSSNQRSSGEWPLTYDGQGIFNSTDPRLRDANLVYIEYCTSDAYSGASPSSSIGFAFQGRSVVRSVFSDLISSRGLGRVPGTNVLYGGCSAGARGAMFNADAVGAQLRAALGGNVTRYGALLDSAFWQDIEPYNSSLPSLMNVTAQAVELYGNAALALPECKMQYPAEDQTWRCYYGAFLLPHVKESFFLHQFLYDSYQLGKDGAGKITPSGAIVEYDETFRTLTHQFAAVDVKASALKPGDKGAMLPACYKHCNTLEGTWSTLMTQGKTLEEAVTSWFFRDGTVDDYVESSCVGFNCGCTPHTS